jgi:protoporphyrinogen oxidase
MKKTAIIIGGGPAGLTAAYEFLTRTDIVPVVLEKSAYMGGISRTVNYKGNRIDIGGHRFFSKSDRVMRWWLQHMPVDEEADASGRITYQRKERQLPVARAAASGNIAGGENKDGIMLVRPRKSRIYFLRKFFDYPIKLSYGTLRNLGAVRTVRIGASYIRAVLFPPRQVDNLEEFFISRFGRELYVTFFKSYTEKVWGVGCREISAEWGAQRIKGLSIVQTLKHIVKSKFIRSKSIHQKDIETSLIERFLYPKFGPGQMWDIVAQKVVALGGTILTEFEVQGLHVNGQRVVSVTGRNSSGESQNLAGDYFFSTMPVKELINSLDADVPQNVREVSDGLIYRDFITVGLLLKRLTVTDKKFPAKLISDNWIYIQESDVLAGRLQIFNNWSPHLVRDPETVWLGVEYFCYDTDELWRLPDAEMAALAQRELEKIGIIDRADVLDFTVIHMPKTYPAYFGTYDRFDELRSYIDGYNNLFLVGRNGMHKYNNQDHSMLTAMTAVDNIVAGRTDKSNLWLVNTEDEYHEQKAEAASATV